MKVRYVFNPFTGQLDEVTDPGSGAVTSVNGQTGAVILDTDDIPEGSSNLYFTVERAQDAVGTILADTDTIDLIYSDSDPSIKANARLQMSIVSDSNGIMLDGDDAAPGLSYYYGTDGAGNKGFFPLPPGSTPGGLDTQVQFNDGGNFAGSGDLTFDKTTGQLTTKTQKGIGVTSYFDWETSIYHDEFTGNGSIDLSSNRYLLSSDGFPNIKWGQQGWMTLFKDAAMSASATLKDDNLTGHHEYFFPDEDGTLALLSDIPTVPQFADAETPSGVIDGVNDTFTLANAPSPAASLQLFLSNNLQIQGTDYNLSGVTITFVVPPAVDNTSLLAWYRF